MVDLHFPWLEQIWLMQTSNSTIEKTVIYPKKESALISYSYPVLQIHTLNNIWHHPVLDFYNENSDVLENQISSKVKFFPTPNSNDEEDGDLVPTPINQLPNLNNWVSAFAQGIVEIFARRRNPAQLSRWCHNIVFTKLIERTKLGFPKNSQIKIRRIMIHQPVEGIAEVTLVINIDEKVRAIVLRFEGVNQKWQCTYFEIIE